MKTQLYYISCPDCEDRYALNFLDYLFEYWMYDLNFYYMFFQYICLTKTWGISKHKQYKSIEKIIVFLELSMQT